MHYEEAKKLREEEFQRLTGVKRRTYDKMIEILRPHEEAKRKKGGRKPTLCLEDQVLMALEYWREYRTYFHIGKNYGISESAAYLGIRWIEDTLIKDGVFSLPSRRALAEIKPEEIILIDATETPVERPKKNSAGVIQARRSDTQSRVKLL
jgi:hypothetical protein